MPQGSQGECGRRALLITFRSVFIIMTLCVMWQFNKISNLSGGARFAGFDGNPFCKNPIFIENFMIRPARE